MSGNEPMKARRLDHRPPCPHCSTRLAYDDAVNDYHECPECGGAIVWSVPLGSLRGGTFTPDSSGPEWRVLT